MTDAIARVTEMSCGYRKRAVLEGVTFRLPAGVTGILGPNGAGKSTLLSVLSTRRAASSGEVHILGSDLSDAAGREAVRRRLGFLPQRYPLVGSMRVLDTVAYAAWTHGLPQRACYGAAQAALAQVEIADLSDRRVRALSGGQRQRVGLAAALAHQPDLILLDEPTAGLDPEIRLSLRETLRSIAETDTVVLTTHLIEDVVALCDTVLVLDQGRLVFQGGVSDLERYATSATDRRAASPMERAYAALLDSVRSRAN
ncbi:ATP-binding cassette domain-containing protein [Georgenia satyanarayanai]|uniref:ABC transporter ATP-binding protein n=1 Tax=Georgenia satyanarayanai TaxID=860221 RepID=UPI002040CE9F|nr:ATP-binding cassette domain-containing protein [Georgenia satyanarayanai]MCM3662630.1 ATP-binding cassette domain-containing protein [Georgenia satyanarayanai]